MKEQTLLLWHLPKKTALKIAKKLGMESPHNSVLPITAPLLELALALHETILEEHEPISPFLDSLDTLSSKEKTVLWHTALQKNTAQIAEELCIAKGTVRKHLDNMIQKLNLGGYQELRKMAVEYKNKICLIISLNNANMRGGGNTQNHVQSPIKYVISRIDRRLMTHYL